MNKLVDRAVLPLEQMPNRREFCRTLTVGGAALVTVGGCVGMPARATDGGKDLTKEIAPDMTEAPAPDMAMAPEDMAQVPGVDMTDTRDMSRLPDMVDPNACPGKGIAKTDRKPASFAMNTATFFLSGNCFVCRDGGGLFAVTAVCTHAGCTIGAVNGGAGGFSCPCHGSTFALDGARTGGLAQAPLSHFGLCLDGSGNVGIATLQVVASNKRYSF